LLAGVAPAAFDKFQVSQLCPENRLSAITKNSVFFSRLQILTGQKKERLSCIR